MLERLLIVGLGSIGMRHVRLVRQLLPDVEIVALRHRASGDFSAYGIERCVTSLDEAMRFRPQAAVVSSPASCHLDAAMPLAEAGVHLLIEKPISNATANVARLIEKCRQRGCVLMTGYNLRFMESLQCFRELINAGRIGHPISVRAETGQYLPSWRPDVDYRQTVSAREELGGGVLLELSHEIDYLRWLFGEVEWVSAIQRRQSALEIDVEDTAHLVIGFAPELGKKALSAALSIDFVRHDTTRICTVIGDRGSLRWNALTGTVEVFEQGASAWQPHFVSQPQRDASYLDEWRHFLGCIDEERQPMISGEDGLAVLRIIEAARRSSAAGAVVRIADDIRQGERALAHP